MKHQQKKKLPITISFFSPVGIVFTSIQGSYWIYILTGMACSFLMMLGLTDLTAAFLHSKSVAALFFIVGLAGLSWILYYRSKASEIMILDPSRQLTGIPGERFPLSFSDVSHFVLKQIDGDLEIFLYLKDKRQIRIAYGFPLNITYKVAIHAAKMVGVSVKDEEGVEIQHSVDIDWKLPSRLPSGQFPLEYLVLSSILAAFIVIVAFINLGSIFHLDIAPKWMLLLAISFPASQLLTNIRDNRGFKTACVVFALILSGIYGITVLSLLEPASSFFGLIPAGVVFLFLINAWVERKKLLPWILLAILCGLPGCGITLFASYQFHIFFRLDPAVVSTVQLDQGGEHMSEIISPNEIGSILKTLQKAELKKQILSPSSSELELVFNRPAGRNYKVKLKKEGIVQSSQAVYKLYCDLGGMDFPLGQMTSHEMSASLQDISSLYGYWPPGY